MFPAASLLTLLLAVWTQAIAGSPVEARNNHATLSIAKRINARSGAINLIEHDRARAAAILKKHDGAVQSSQLALCNEGVPLTNFADIEYTVSVGVGSPATYYTVILDTGSANTWVGANISYTPTNSSEDTGQPFAVRYGSANVTGEEWLDTVTLSSDFVIARQSIGVASNSSGIPDGIDGILGIGPVNLTIGNLKNEPNASIPTVIDNLYDQLSISRDMFSVSFAPSITGDNVSGILTLGGTNDTLYTGKIGYTPITSTYPSSRYWGIDQSITYGNQTILSKTAGIVDTGTTLIMISSDAYSVYQSATGATMDSNTGLLSLNTSQYDNLQNLNFNIGNETYTLIPNSQIWPRALNSYINGSTTSVYLVVASLGTLSGKGFDFFNGMMFLERFYSVFDTTNRRVGFATTQHTYATTN